MSFVSLRKKRRVRSAYTQKLKRKTSGSAKVRFKLSKNLHLMSTQSNKQHNMRKRSGRQIKNQRGTVAIKTRFARKLIKFYCLVRRKRKH